MPNLVDPVNYDLTRITGRRSWGAKLASKVEDQGNIAANDPTGRSSAGADVETATGRVAMKVSDILASKGNLVITIKPTETIGALSSILRENRIGAAVVSSDGETADGVITERDIAFGLAQHGAGMHAMPVAALMTRAVVTCSPDDDVSLVSSTMLSRNIRHIPVVAEGRLTGMVSIRDLLRVQVGALQQEAAMLRGLVNEVERVPQDR